MTTRNALSLELITKMPKRLGDVFGPFSRFKVVEGGTDKWFGAVDAETNVMEPVQYGRTLAELVDACNYRLAFDAVVNPADWKGEIDAVVRKEHVAIIAKAVEFFTSTAVTVQVLGESAHITSIGYRRGPAA